MTLTDDESRRVEEFFAFFSKSQKCHERLEMFLAVTERVLTHARDSARDRQLSAIIADRLWRAMGDVQEAVKDAHLAACGGWIRVASLTFQQSPPADLPEPIRRAVVRSDVKVVPDDIVVPCAEEFARLLAEAMSRIARDEPVDVRVRIRSSLRVYRFQSGRRTLIDRQGSRRGRVH